MFEKQQELYKNSKLETRFYLNFYNINKLTIYQP